MPYFRRFVLSCLWPLLFGGHLLYAAVVVIGNENLKAKSLSSAQVSNLYLGKTNQVSKQDVNVYDQAPSSAQYANFYQQIMGWSPDQVSSYWTQVVFSGQGNQPEQIGGGLPAIRYIAQTPGAIAYVEASVLQHSGYMSKVKVLYGKIGADQSYGQNMATSRPTNKRGAINMSLPSGNLYVKQSNMTGRPDQTPHSLTARTDNYQLPMVSPDEALWLNMQQHFTLTAQYSQPQVQQQVAWFLRHRSTLNVMIRNSIPYIAYVYQQTQANNMPAEFALLPMLESGYNPYAYSRVGAAGLWQMMPQTATLYGLNIGWWYDSRRDILLSTRAALGYLVSLHRQFSNWDLAAAAYNAGGGAVSHAIRINRADKRATDYWNLPLPSETRAYVPKLLALADIIQNAQRYHVVLPNLTSKPFFSAVTIQSQMDLTQLSKDATISINLLHYLNPGMRRFATDSSGPYTLLLPTVVMPTFQHHVAKLVGRVKMNWQYHDVYPGETLAKIARDYHVSENLILRANGLSSANVTSGQGLLVPVYLGKRYKPLGSIGVYRQVARIGGISASDILTGKIATIATKMASSDLTKPLGKQPVANHFVWSQYNPQQDLRILITWFIFNVNLLH